MVNKKSNENRIALVTGTSRLKGIGAAVCKKLAEEGIDVFFTYWSRYDAKQKWGIEESEPAILKSQIEKHDVRCVKREIDLSNPDNIKVLLDEVVEKLGTPSILINNACHSTTSNYQDIDSKLMDNHYNINLRLTTLLSSNFARIFDKKEGGRIINLSSGQFKGPMKNELAYAVTKGGVDALTITLAAEVASKGITVNTVNPGPTDTGWMDQTTKEELKEKFPFKRLGRPKDAANLISFLVSKEAAWITGEVINSDGGFYN